MKNEVEPCLTLYLREQNHDQIKQIPSKNLQGIIILSLNLSDQQMTQNFL